MKKARAVSSGRAQDQVGGTNPMRKRVAKRGDGPTRQSAKSGAAENTASRPHLHHGRPFRVLAELQAAVLEQCVAEATWFLGRPWTPADTKALRAGYGPKGDDDASELWARRDRELQAERAIIALDEAVRGVIGIFRVDDKRNGGVGPWGFLVRIVAPRLEGPIAGTLRTTVPGLSRGAGAEWSQRSFLVADNDSLFYGLLDPRGQRRHPTPRELAILSLIAGNLPSFVISNGVTVSQVIRWEQRAIESAQRHQRAPSRKKRWCCFCQDWILAGQGIATRATCPHPDQDRGGIPIRDLPPKATKRSKRTL